MKPPSPDELRTAIQDAIDRGDYTRSNEWENAFHEAGHVVVEVKLAGSFPDSAYLSDDPTTDHAGRTWTRSFLLAEYDDLDLSQLPANERKVFQEVMATQRDHYGAVLAAGQLAGYIACGLTIDIDDLVARCLYDDEEDLDSDITKLQNLALAVLRAVGRSDDEWQAGEKWLAGVFTSATDTLRGAWQDVERVATALVEHRGLDREALWDLLPL